MNNEQAKNEAFIGGSVSNAGLGDFERMKSALEYMVRLEPCDCGCPWKCNPILLKPAHYYALAKEALGICAVESRDSGRTGLPVVPMTNPANSEPEHVCRETAQTPNVK